MRAEDAAIVALGFGCSVMHYCWRNGARIEGAHLPGCLLLRCCVPFAVHHPAPSLPPQTHTHTDSIYPLHPPWYLFLWHWFQCVFPEQLICWPALPQQRLELVGHGLLAITVGEVKAWTGGGEDGEKGGQRERGECVWEGDLC